MATKKTIGSYKGTPIYAGTDAEVAAQMKTIDAKTATPAPAVNPPVVPVAPQKTQADLDLEYAQAAAAHPVFAGNSPAAISYATSTGDYSSLMNSEGKPFSNADQRAAVSEASAALDPYYQAEQKKETQNTESALASKQADYQKYLIDQGQQFQTDKTALDQKAADSGVLFSGGRLQKQKQLGSAYVANNAYKMNTVGSDIGNTARDFGYKYGDTAAKGLSSYYNLGGNTYNPNVATGGVGSQGLSSIYNPNKGFQGTQINAAKSEVQKRAAGLLANKGNKLLATGYTNQY